MGSFVSQPVREEDEGEVPKHSTVTICCRGLNLRGAVFQFNPILPHQMSPTSFQKTKFRLLKNTLKRPFICKISNIEYIHQYVNAILYNKLHSCVPKQQKNKQMSDE